MFRFGDVRVGSINEAAIEELMESGAVSDQVADAADELVTVTKAGAPVRTGTLRSSVTKVPVGNGVFRVGWDHSIAEYGPVVEFKYVPHLRPAAENIKRR